MINQAEALKLQEVKKLIDNSSEGLCLTKTKLWNEPVDKTIMLNMALALEGLNGASILLDKLIQGAVKQEK